MIKLRNLIYDRIALTSPIDTEINQRLEQLYDACIAFTPSVDPDALVGGIADLLEEKKDLEETEELSSGRTTELETLVDELETRVHELEAQIHDLEDQVETRRPSTLSTSPLIQPYKYIAVTKLVDFLRKEDRQVPSLKRLLVEIERELGDNKPI